MHNAAPITTDILLIGGGHTHALVLRKWGMDPMPGVRLTLVNPGPTAPYTGMLPGHVAGHYRREELDIDLVRLCRFAGARLIVGEVSGLDPVARTASVKGRPPIRFDVASINIGITSGLGGIPVGHAIRAKPLGPFADRWRDFVTNLSFREPVRLAIVGGGVGGVELAMAMTHRIRGLGLEVRTTIIEAADQILSAESAALRKKLSRELDKQGVHVRTGCKVKGLIGEQIQLESGEVFASDFTALVAGARTPAWLAESGLELESGFIAVNRFLKARHDGTAPIFAAGDIAHLKHAPRPKAGVFAVREAPVLYNNLRAAVSGKVLQTYEPQRDYLKLVSLGARKAVASKWGLAPGLPGLWAWKDRIDRNFMEKLRELPAMENAPGSAQPLCGGCGAKVAPDALTQALSDLPAAGRNDVETGLGDDAAILRVGGARQAITTDHFRAFTSDPFLLSEIAAVHAMGDIWAMGAEPQAALAHVTLPEMTPAKQAETLAEIMAGLSSVVTAHGAEIVGGHSTMGAELSVGLTVTGMFEEGRTPIGLSGAQAGDVLILTKPLGTGVIFAAEMQLAARGDDVVRALESMRRPLASDANALAPHAHAMTDVTGFGLAGHLVQMLDTSGVSARLALPTLPLLPGAKALAKRGFQSVTTQQNRHFETAISASAALHKRPEYALLFDPQTAGGLLASVPAGKAADILKAMPHAVRIGEVVASGETALEITE